MAENSQPVKRVEEPKTDEARLDGRRTFVRRAVMIGLPVVLVTVKPRSAWARTASCEASMRPSKTCDGHIPQ